MDSFWEVAVAFASISQVARIIIGALITAVLFGAAAGFLPEAAQKKIAFQASIGEQRAGHSSDRQWNPNQQHWESAATLSSAVYPFAYRGHEVFA
jgi:hypothetical protein